MALIACKECGNQISNKAEKCPSCGAKIPAKIGFIKGLGLVFLGLIMLLYFMADKPGSSVTSAAGREEAAVSALQVNDLKLKKGDFDIVVVTGKLINTTGKKLGYVQVELNLFDSTGTQIGSTLANVNNLEAGLTWSFEAPVMERRVSSIKVGGITAF